MRLIIERFNPITKEPIGILKSVLKDKHISIKEGQDLAIELVRILSYTDKIDSMYKHTMYGEHGTIDYIPN